MWVSEQPIDLAIAIYLSRTGKLWLRMLLPRGVRACLNQLDNLLVSDFTFQSKGSRTLIVSFAGMTGLRRTFATLKQRVGLEVRPFEFVHSLKDRDCDVLFLRDRHRAYYHSGVKGVGKTVDDVADFLNDFMSKRGYDLVVTLGHSMGGYASILFASKINADVCIAISTPTFLDQENRVKYNDERYAHEKRKLYESKLESFRYLDLRSYFLSNERPKNRKNCVYCLFYGDSDRLDKIHATRMVGIDQPIHIFEVIGGDHNAARTMRDSGLLFRLCDSILSINSREHANTLLRTIESDHSIRRSLSPRWSAHSAEMT
jgi:pimeloyl-ACP methyl ester carboxylesterase